MDKDYLDETELSVATLLVAHDTPTVIEMVAEYIHINWSCEETKRTERYLKMIDNMDAGVF